MVTNMACVRSVPNSGDGMEQVTLNLVHGRENISMLLELGKQEAGGRLTFGHVQRRVQQLTGFPPERQKLVYKGKRLLDPKAFLSELGMKDGSKLMLLPVPLTNEDKKVIAEFNDAKVIIEKHNKVIDMMLHTLDGLHRGYFANERMTQLDKVRKDLKSANEILQQQLERLDSLEFSTATTDIRTQRKPVVDRALFLLDRCDAVEQGLLKLSHYFGMIPRPRVYAYENYP